jgi:hypothetical protein
MAKQYDITMKNVMMWADNELEHVGRIVAVKDADLQYSYALSTVNGMAHLKDALDQLIKDGDITSASKRDLKIKQEQVIRVMNHLVKDFALDIAPIKAFNVKKVLGSLDYLISAVAAGKKNGPTNNPAPAVEEAARGETVFSTGEPVPPPNSFNKRTYTANSTGVKVPVNAAAKKAANNAAFNEAKRNGAALFENTPAAAAAPANAAPANAAAKKAANNAAFNEAKRNGEALFENTPSASSAAPAPVNAAPVNAAAKKAANNAAFNEAKRNGAALFENTPPAAPAKGGRRNNKSRKGRKSRKSNGSRKGKGNRRN